MNIERECEREASPWRTVIQNCFTAFRQERATACHSYTEAIFATYSYERIRHEKLLWQTRQRRMYLMERYPHSHYHCNGSCRSQPCPRRVHPPASCLFFTVCHLKTKSASSWARLSNAREAQTERPLFSFLPFLCVHI